MIKAVIFDMDGLLMDTERIHVACWQEAAKIMGYEMSYETALDIRSLAAEFAEPFLKEKLGNCLDYEKLRQTKRELFDIRLKEKGLIIKEGAVELLTWLGKEHYKKAVATATRIEKAEEFLSALKIRSYFDTVISVSGVAHGKPEPDVYLEACRCLGEETVNCLALEDSPNGALSALRAGCQTVMIPDLSPVPEELKEKLTGWEDNLKDVIRFIQNL